MHFIRRGPLLMMIFPRISMVVVAAAALMMMSQFWVICQRETLRKTSLFLPLFRGLTTGRSWIRSPKSSPSTNPPKAIVDSYVLMTMSTTPCKNLSIYMFSFFFFWISNPLTFSVIPSWVACSRRYLVV